MRSMFGHTDAVCVFGYDVKMIGSPLGLPILCYSRKKLHCHKLFDHVHYIELSVSDQLSRYSRQVRSITFLASVALIGGLVCYCTFLGLVHFSENFCYNITYRWKIQTEYIKIPKPVIPDPPHSCP